MKINNIKDSWQFVEMHISCLEHTNIILRNSSIQVEVQNSQRAA